MTILSSSPTVSTAKAPLVIALDWSIPAQRKLWIHIIEACYLSSIIEKAPTDSNDPAIILTEAGMSVFRYSETKRIAKLVKLAIELFPELKDKAIAFEPANGILSEVSLEDFFFVHTG